MITSMHTSVDMKINALNNLIDVHGTELDLPWGEVSETIVNNIEKISFFSDQVSWISDKIIRIVGGRFEHRSI